ncbi:hypothetical protein CEW89_08560 [Celeribacter ethanolicus]|uniref:Uncharacterized protein n=2 Tax=Celeribacter ethanolicus TaxID=1758178 RepID=A0A291GHU6_9RHOB|nr:hypothetical protein CEW89_08560 [Celeribacter ethanolicus]
MPLPQQAGILCNDPRFQKFAATRSGFPGGQFTAEASAEYLRHVCNIESRRELATSEIAQTKFAALRTEFDAWTGKIANQR